jgi:hypothetical protein
MNAPAGSIASAPALDRPVVARMIRQLATHRAVPMSGYKMDEDLTDVHDHFAAGLEALLEIGSARFWRPVQSPVSARKRLTALTR